MVSQNLTANEKNDTAYDILIELRENITAIEAQERLCKEQQKAKLMLEETNQKLANEIETQRLNFLKSKPQLKRRSFFVCTSRLFEENIGGSKASSFKLGIDLLWNLLKDELEAKSLNLESRINTCQNFIRMAKAEAIKNPVLQRDRTLAVSEVEAYFQEKIKTDPSAGESLKIHFFNFIVEMMKNSQKARWSCSAGSQADLTLAAIVGGSWRRKKAYCRSPLGREFEMITQSTNFGLGLGGGIAFLMPSDLVSDQLLSGGTLDNFLKLKHMASGSTFYDFILAMDANHFGPGLGFGGAWLLPRKNYYSKTRDVLGYEQGHLLLLTAFAKLVVNCQQ